MELGPVWLASRTGVVAARPGKDARATCIHEAAQRVNTVWRIASLTV